MRQRFSSIHIATPCQESWAAMTPASGGRHCASCQKVVVDFTQKTDAEILAFLARASQGSTCGRLRATQLGRQLVAPTTAPRWRVWLGAVLATGSVLSATKAYAQALPSYYSGGPAPATSTTNGTAPSHLPKDTTPTQALPTTTDEPLLLRGIVTDATTHEGLPGVTVLLKGTTMGTSTDASGAFVLPLASGTVLVQLIFSYVGYTHQEITVASGQMLSVTLAEEAQGLLSEVVVAGGVSQQPWPWHPRRLFNWSKYWLAKTFRRV